MSYWSTVVCPAIIKQVAKIIAADVIKLKNENMLRTLKFCRLSNLALNISKPNNLLNRIYLNL